MTREELLEKGVSEDVADEIVAAFDDASASDSLALLEKALSDEPKEQLLFKASDEDEDDDEDGYDEEYMRKYMKKYMMANKSACAKAAKEVGLFADEMKKASDSFDMDVQGAVVEMAELAPYLEKQAEFTESLAKAMELIVGQVGVLAAKVDGSYDLMQKAARVQVEQAKALDGVLSTPNGRKGVTATMAKAAALPEFTPDMNKAVYSALFKATRDGDRTAGAIISLFESAGQDVRALTQEQRKYVNELLTKEVN